LNPGEESNFFGDDPKIDIYGVGVDQMIAGPDIRAGGKSELHRAGWSLTATGGDPKESATENIPPANGR
jgi:hypothetical protein